MKKFIDFFYETSGGVAGTTSGPSVAGTGSDSATTPRSSLLGMVRRLKPKHPKPPVHHTEDTKKDQEARLKQQKSKVDPDISIDNPRTFPLDQVGKVVAEANFPRDAEGRIVTPEREESGGFWSSHKHPKGELEWFPRKKVIKVGDKTWTRTIDDKPTPKPKVDKGKTTKGKAADVLRPEMERRAAERQKEAREKQELKQLRMQKAREKLQKQQSPSLRERMLKKEDFNLNEEDLKVGDAVHLGFGAKGGAGFKGTIHKITDDGKVFVKTEHNPNRIVQGSIKLITKL